MCNSLIVSPCTARICCFVIVRARFKFSVQIIVSETTDNPVVPAASWPICKRLPEHDLFCSDRNVLQIHGKYLDMLCAMVLLLFCVFLYES
jgi:hypothetical protein